MCIWGGRKKKEGIKSFGGRKILCLCLRKNVFGDGGGAV